MNLFKTCENFAKDLYLANVALAKDVIDFAKTKQIERNVVLPKEYKLISLGDNFIAKTARSYMKGRGFRISKLESAGVGYCPGYLRAITNKSSL